MSKKLLIFGYGYTARAVAKQLASTSWQVVSTSREAENYAQAMIDVIDFDHAQSALAECTHILITIPPHETGDPVITQYAEVIAQHQQSLQWLGYISTTGVYGDQQGAWVDEATPTQPDNERSQRRVIAENAWLALGRQCKVPTHIFRVAGIYGPERNIIQRLQSGEAQNIVKPGQFFSRIYVDDLARVLIVAMQQANESEIFNICDDEPAGSHEVMQYVADQLKLPMPPAIPFEQAELSPMAKSFYQSNRRVRNQKMKDKLSVHLQYPTFREGYLELIRQI